MTGIDFGTTTSLASESDFRGSHVVAIGTVDPWLPSILGMDRNALLAGEATYRLPEQQLLRSVKRTITRRESTVSIFDGQEPVEIDADTAVTALLRTIRDHAEQSGVDFLSTSSVRLGCPAMWTGDQRRRLIRLAQLSGLPVGDETLIDEPIAAAVAWINAETRARRSVKGKVLVFDMGGGTLDVAVLDVEAGPYSTPSISVQSSVGVDEAGDALDEALAQVLEAKLIEEGHADVLGDPDLHGWVLRAARRAKVDLGERYSVPVVLEYPRRKLPVLTLYRGELDEAFGPQLNRATGTIQWALRAALMSQVHSASRAISKTPSEARQMLPAALYSGVDYVVPVGGMAAAPAVLDHLGHLFGPDKVRPLQSFSPTEAVALGLGAHSSYERLNLHRPGFDVLLTWETPDGVQHEVVYPAYTPLYDMFSVLQTNSTKYTWRKRRGDLPSKGQGMLRLRSVMGQPIKFRVEDEEHDGLQFEFGQQDVVVTMEPSGKVYFRDGLGRERAMRIAQWPVIRGRKQEAVDVQPIEDERLPELTRALVWHQLPYD